MTRGKVLVADDEPDLRFAYSRILRSDDYEVATAANGAECLAACRRELPDLVLLDAVMPDSDGLDLCRQIKADPELAGVFVILISGRRVSPDEQADSLEAGADGALTKPVERRTLLAHIHALMRIKHAERQLRESEERQRQLVAELTETNRRLEEYSRLKAEFVANMSHELRTPLTAIIGFVQLVGLSEKDRPIPPPYALAFERILRNGRHLLALIDDVLDIAKIEAGRLRLHREHFDLGEVVQGAFRELQSLARQKGLDYRLRIDGPLPLAFSDPLRVRQVVINLLSNAIKFTSEGLVEAELALEDGGLCCFRVRDTGVGIERAALSFIFERFRQVDGSMSRRAGGAGLGLSIVQQIVELLGGRITVDSEVGRGSVFSVLLPLVAPDPQQAQQGSEPEIEAVPWTTDALATAQESQDGARTVLIVEDDPDSAALLSEAVAGAGYQPRAASSGTSGLDLARQLEPAAVVLDVMMPGMDGWRVLQALKAEPKTARIPVIVCSIVDNRPLGYRLGASDYLIKPVDPQRLGQALQNVSTAGEGEYVLVVDDQHGVRELLSTALRNGGYRVRTAASGETALRLMSQVPPVAVLCDLMLPGGMSGFELIARMRSQPATEHTPVIVITGHDMTPEDRTLLLGEIADVIRKGDLLLSDLEPRLREVLDEIGVRRSHGEHPAG